MLAGTKLAAVKPSRNEAYSELSCCYAHCCAIGCNTAVTSLLLLLLLLLLLRTFEHPQCQLFCHCLYAAV
jgi:hypothetical protein